MKKILLAMALLLAGIVSLQAEDIGEKIKKQCEYLVYGTGEDDVYTTVYMYGAVDGITFLVDIAKRTETALNGTYAQTIEPACKEAFAINDPSSFEDKFKWGIYITSHKDHTKRSLLK